jgi:uncharacterized protein
MSSPSTVEPNYIELVRFLVTPFLEFPESLMVDCETYASQHKVLVRLAFAGSDKGRVFGRGGRTLQAIRTVIEASGTLAGQRVYLEVYGEREAGESQAAPIPSSTASASPGVSRPRPVRREDISSKAD